MKLSDLWKSPDDLFNHLDLIEKISKIRERNNKNWMSILKLAFQHAPKEAKALMRQITENDAEINKLSKRLSED